MTEQPTDQATVDDAIDRATAVMAELDRLQAEYAALSPEELARLPESVASGRYV